MAVRLTQELIRAAVVKSIGDIRSAVLGYLTEIYRLMNNQPDQLDQALDEIFADRDFEITGIPRHWGSTDDKKIADKKARAAIKLLLLKARKEELRLACENWEKNPTKPASYMIDRTDELKSLEEEMKGVTDGKN